MTGRRADEDLLAACAHEPEAFTELYRRHVAGVLAYLVRRTHHAELATDLAAEVFATALEKSIAMTRAEPPSSPGCMGSPRTCSEQARGGGGSAPASDLVRGGIGWNGRGA